MPDRIVYALIFILFAVLTPVSQGWAAPNPPTHANPTGDTIDPDPLWQTIRARFDLFYAYRDLRGFDADAYLDRVGAYVTSAPTQAVFRRRLNQASYAFTDPHLGFGPMDDSDFNVIPTASDLEIGLTDDRFIVLDVRAGSAALKAGIRPGWVLTHIGDQPISTAALSVFAPLIDDPSSDQLAYGATLHANGRRTGNRYLRFIDAIGETVTLTLANPREQARAVMAKSPIQTQRIMAGQGQEIAILRINNRLGDNDLIKGFDAAVTNVMDADGLILDLRNTPSGGNAEVGRSIMGHFTDEARPYQMHERPSLEREFDVLRRYVEYVLPRAPLFDPDRTVVLGGYWTGSMGEGIVIGMDAIGVETIASDMGDLLGGMSYFTFADGAISLSVPNETLFHVDGRPREDFIADTHLPSADSDAKGGDPALSAAIAILLADKSQPR